MCCTDIKINKINRYIFNDGLCTLCWLCLQNILLLIKSNAPANSNIDAGNALPHRGISNLDKSSCFIIAVVQILRSLQPFKDYLEEVNVSDLNFGAITKGLMVS